MAIIDTLDAYWQDIKKIPTLDAEAQRELAERIKSGDEGALNRLVTANLRYVVSIARQFADKTELKMSDLISEGNIAMMAAARKWNPDKEESFARYAQHDIRKAMQNAIASQSAAMALPRKGTGADGSFRQMSVDAPVHPGQTNTLGDMLKAGRPTTDEGAENAEMSHDISVALQGLSEREQTVMARYYGIGTDDSMTMAEIAESMGLKRERVRQIRKTAERKMRRMMLDKEL